MIKATTRATINNIFGIRKKTDSNDVYLKYFRQLCFSTENSPGVTLRVQSKKGTNQKATWTAVINCGACKMLSNIGKIACLST